MIKKISSLKGVLRLRALSCNQCNLLSTPTTHVSLLIGAKLIFSLSKLVPLNLRPERRVGEKAEACSSANDTDQLIPIDKAVAQLTENILVYYEHKLIMIMYTNSVHYLYRLVLIICICPQNIFCYQYSIIPYW